MMDFRSTHGFSMKKADNKMNITAGRILIQWTHHESHWRDKNKTLVDQLPVAPALVAQNKWRLLSEQPWYNALPILMYSQSLYSLVTSTVSSKRSTISSSVTSFIFSLYCLWKTVNTNIQQSWLTEHTNTTSSFASACTLWNAAAHAYMKGTRG